MRTSKKEYSVLNKGNFDIRNSSMTSESNSTRQKLRKGFYLKYFAL